MKNEQRRFFRINETIGLSYELMDKKEQSSQKTMDVLDLMSGQDEKIETLLSELQEESPKVAELIRAFNQKLERIVSQITVESRLVGKLANKAKEVNISACGLGFTCHEEIPLGSQLKLSLQLFPSDKMIKAVGIVVGCDPQGEEFYWRIDFYGMSQDTEELLIQHIVQRQSVQLYTKK